MVSKANNRYPGCIQALAKQYQVEPAEQHIRPLILQTARPFGSGQAHSTTTGR